MSTTTTNPTAPHVTLTDAVRDAEETLRGDGDLTLTSALRQLLGAVRAQLPVTDYTVQCDGNAVAVIHGYGTARAVARLLSHDTSGTYTMWPPAGTTTLPETWTNGLRANLDGSYAE